MTPKQYARLIVATHDTRNPYQIADVLGIMVAEEYLGKHIKGVIIRVDGDFYTCINSNLHQQEKRIVLAHELGHAILHRHLNYFFMLECTHYPIGRFEREANEFASELLIDDKDLWEVKEETAEYAAKVLGVTQELLTIKAQTLVKG